MKRVISTISVTLASWAALAQAPGQFSIKGTLMGGADGDTILLATPSGGGLTPVDTALVDKGAFTFSGTVDGARLVFLLGVNGGVPAFGSSVVAEAGTLNVRLYSDPDREAEVVGNVTNSLWRLFAMRDNEIMTQAQPYVNAMRNPNLAAQARKGYQQTLDSLSTLRVANVMSFVEQNKTTMAADLVFEMYCPMLHDDDRGKLAVLLSQNSPTLPGFRRAMARVEQEEAAHRADVGRRFTDFVCADANGKPVRLSEIVKANKVTLLDFWASWCGPCRMEMPTVRRAYEAFRSRGLEVVGVSLDSNRKSWLNAVETLGLGWVHLSDLKGWRCEPAALYGVHSIPASLLIAQDGTIIAKDLRGQQLIETLSKVLR